MGCLGAAAPLKCETWERRPARSGPVLKGGFQKLDPNPKGQFKLFRRGIATHFPGHEIADGRVLLAGVMWHQVARLGAGADRSPVTPAARVGCKEPPPRQVVQRTEGIFLSARTLCCQGVCPACA